MVYLVLRQAFGGTLLLGLEVLVAADLVRTVAVAPTLDNVLVLGLIVVIRTFLSFSLETEIEGVAPWRRALIGGAGTIRGPRLARWSPRRRPDTGLASLGTVPGLDDAASSALAMPQNGLAAEAAAVTSFWHAADLSTGASRHPPVPPGPSLRH